VISHGTLIILGFVRRNCSCCRVPSNSALLGGLFCTRKLAILYCSLYRVLAVGRNQNCLHCCDEWFGKQWGVYGRIIESSYHVFCF